MDRPKLNFVIDALMFLALMGMAGLGFLMKYVLPPGREARLKYGGPVGLTWLGRDRHDWGDIHLYLAFTLLALLTLHIILHWQQILGLFQRLLPSPRTRFRVAMVFLLLALLLIYFPFLVTPEVQQRGRGGCHGAEIQQPEIGRGASAARPLGGAPGAPCIECKYMGQIAACPG